jgi:hypothetical protein
MERSQRSGTSEALHRHDDVAERQASIPGKQTLTQSLGDEDAGAPVQRVATAEGPRIADGETTRRTAAAGVAGAGGPLPHLDRIQRLFGPAHDVSGISAHVGGPAADASEQIGARAYATGTRVAFAQAPDLHTAAHEAAHVVQQRSGVQLKGDIGDAGDAYEQHADAVAERVVQGESAADLLEAGPTHQGGTKSANAVQRAPAVAPAGAQKVVGDLATAIAAGEWEAIRKRVYPHEAAAARTRANKRRAGKAPDLAGLGTVTSLDAIAAAIKALQGVWAGKSPTERGDAMISAANTALTAAKVPTYLDHEIVSMTARGSFNRALWKFNIREATVHAPSLTNDEAGEVANTVAHESRHAEQHFLRGRYLAGTGMLAPDIEAATGMPPVIATEAFNQKLTAKDPRFAEAKKMDKAFGADAAKNRTISAQVDVEIAMLNSQRADAIAARSALQASATAATIAAGKKTLAALKAQTLKVEKAYLAYRAIPYEADAHEVGDSEAEAFSKLP